MRLWSRIRKLIIIVILVYCVYSFIHSTFPFLFDENYSPAYSKFIPVSKVKYEGPKYIQFVCDQPSKVCGGWADRLKGVFSTYALSMILNRTFLMKITQPCHLNTIIRPNLVDWDQKNRDARWQPASVYDLNIQYDYGIAKKFETVDVLGFFSKMDSYQVINVHSSIMFSDSFRLNPLLRNRTRELGFLDQSKFRLYNQLHTWYNELFSLPPPLEIKYQRIKSQLRVNPNTFVICAQIRTGATTATGNKDPYFADRATISHKYWTFINKTFLRQMHKYTDDPDNYRIYVTADYDPFKEEAANVFGRDKVVFNQDKTVHMDRDHANLEKQCGSIEAVIVDFHTLQNCDASVIGHSGFGMLGNWNRQVPNKNLYVYTKPNPEDMKREYWERDVPFDFVKVNDFDKDVYFL